MNVSAKPLQFLEQSSKKVLIGGNWVDAVSGKTFETINPSTGQVLAVVPECDAADIDLAVAAARAAFEGPWSRVKPYDRQALMLRLADIIDAHYDELAALDTMEMGTPIQFSRMGRRQAVGMLRYYAGQAVSISGDTIQTSIPGDFLTYTSKEPVGVVGAITPWNFPINAAIMKIGPVLATGCTVVLKPSEESVLSALRLGELCLEAGVPEGVVNVVTGFGATAGAALTTHMDVDKVAFTGSLATGQQIVRASAGNMKKVSMELGGKSPDIVFADADLDEAVIGAAFACFGNSGQICSAGTRLLVERSIYDDFTQKVAEFGQTLQMGDSSDPDTVIGPLVSARQLERVSGYIKVGEEEGATALSGGSRRTDGDFAKGYFVSPTVFRGVENSMRIAQEEIFGPVLSAIPFDTFDDALTIANRTSYGLGSGCWTRDLDKANRMARDLKAGVVWVNCYNAFDPAMPFGGNKMSGYGREMGPHHIEDYLDTKAVWVKR